MMSSSIFTDLNNTELSGVAFKDQMLKKMYFHFGSHVFGYTSDMNFKNIFTEAIGLFYLTGFRTGIKLTKD